MANNVPEYYTLFSYFPFLILCRDKDMYLIILRDSMFGYPADSAFWSSVDNPADEVISHDAYNVCLECFNDAGSPTYDDYYKVCLDQDKVPITPFSPNNFVDLTEEKQIIDLTEDNVINLTIPFQNEVECPICQEVNTDFVLKCGHPVHTECMNQWSLVSGAMKCPLCRVQHSKRCVPLVNYKNNDSEDNASGSEEEV